MSSLKVCFPPLVLTAALLASSLPAAPGKIQKPLTPRQVMEHLEGPSFPWCCPSTRKGTWITAPSGR